MLQLLNDQSAKANEIYFLAQHVAENNIHEEGVQDSVALMDALIIQCLHSKLDGSLKEAIELAANLDDRTTFQLLEEVINLHASTLYVVETYRTFQVSLFLTPVVVVSRGGLKKRPDVYGLNPRELIENKLRELKLQDSRSSAFIVPHVFHPSEINALRYSDVLHLTNMATSVFSGDRNLVPDGSFYSNDRDWPKQELSAQSQILELMYIMSAGRLDITDQLAAKSGSDLLDVGLFIKDPIKVASWSKSTEALLTQLLSKDNQIESVTVKPTTDFYTGICEGESFYLNFGVFVKLTKMLTKLRISPESIKAVFSGKFPAASNPSIELSLQLISTGDVIGSVQRPLRRGDDTDTLLENLYMLVMLLGVDAVYLSQFDNPSNTIKFVPGDCELQDCAAESPSPIH